MIWLGIVVYILTSEFLFAKNPRNKDPFFGIVFHCMAMIGLAFLILDWIS